MTAVDIFAIVMLSVLMADLFINNLREKTPILVKIVNKIISKS